MSIENGDFICDRDPTLEIHTRVNRTLHHPSRSSSQNGFEKRNLISSQL
jgi:hypothetical protein